MFGSLVGVAQLVGALSHRPKGCSSIAGQSKCLGYRFGPQSGCLNEVTDRYFSFILMFLFLSQFFPSLPCKINKLSSGEGRKEGRKEGRTEERKEGRTEEGRKEERKKRDKNQYCYISIN